MSAPEWIATYRLQLHRDFPLGAAAGVIPYLADLGISHVYLSPCLRAGEGSSHGYDVVDPTRISDDLGGETAWGGFCRTAREHRMGVLLDIVPNHMSTSCQNPWWADLLTHGPYSAHAGTFDIDPRADGEPWRLRLCTLDKPYGRVLAAGGFRLDLDGAHPSLEYAGQAWPLNPLTWAEFLDEHPGEASTVAGRLRRVLEPDEAARVIYARAIEGARARWDEVRADGASLEGARRRAEELAGDPGRMHALLLRQYYRPCSWRLEGELVNYRRFFNIGGLVGLRVEQSAVFAAAHARIRRMLEAGEIDGVRVDHPDGLRDPAGYLRDLRGLLPRGRIYVEKILDADEVLPAGWPVDGTVGYDFLSKVNRLWMHGEKADRLTAIYTEYTGHTVNFPKLVREKKLAIIEAAFEADCHRIVDMAVAIARRDWRTQDLSRAQVDAAVRALTSLIAVYRTYLPGERGEDRGRDLEVLAAAVAEARAFSDGTDPAVFDFLHDVLAREEPDAEEADFIARWQQLTPAVMAKGTEDTTFYIYDRLVSGNEVGSQPSALGIPAERFHAFLHELSVRWPRNLLATSTHDNKRSEDVRLRISLLTEIPERWSEAVQAWTRMNHKAWGGHQPDRHAEYLLYQTLVGAWPISAERATAYLLKACREAKVNTSWHEPDPDYEAAVTGFASRILESSDFTASLQEFVAPLLRAAGVHSLAQTLIKLTAPGVPDFYQGTELWDLSLVDPDNRRPVDFDERRKLLARSAAATPAQLMEAWDSGWPKLWLISRVLEFRRRHAQAFAPEAGYEPLMARGARLAHVFGFRRGERVVVLVPRFVLTLGDDWGDTSVALPAGRWESLLSGDAHEKEAPMAALFGAFPVALLHRT